MEAVKHLYEVRARKDHRDLDLISDVLGGTAFLLRKQLMPHILAIECTAYFLKSAALPKFSFCLIRI